MSKDTKKNVKIYKDPDNSAKTYNIYLGITFLVVVIGAFTAGATFVTIFGKSDFSRAIQDWGAFGSYFGGIVGSITSAAALFWLILSVRTQQVELRDTRIALSEAADAQRDRASHAEKAFKADCLKMRFQLLSKELDLLLEERTHVRNGYYQSKHKSEQEHFNAAVRWNDLEDSIKGKIAAMRVITEKLESD